MSLTIHYRNVSLGKNTPQLSGQADIRDQFASRSDIRQASPLKYELKARPEAGNVIVEGECSASFEFICSRCLTPFDATIAFPFHAEFSQTVSEDNEEDMIAVNEDQIDLKPYLDEQLQLELPFIPLCKEDCLGLCPECGTNRNEHPCACKNERIDPRLAGLQGLKDLLNKE